MIHKLISYKKNREKSGLDSTRTDTAKRETKSRRVCRQRGERCRRFQSNREKNIFNLRMTWVHFVFFFFICIGS